MKRLLSALGAGALALALAPATGWSEDYDLVILNGRVMDPQTQLDAVRNVGIKDGKIVSITGRPIEGTETAFPPMRRSRTS